MVPKHFEVGDLVWAKMKGYPYWPGKITNPPDSSKAKKAHHYVFFFGSKNYAWIPDENIEMHGPQMVEKHTKNQKRFFGGYLSAVDEIKSESKNVSKYSEVKDENSEIVVSKVNNNTSPVLKKKISVDHKKKSLEKRAGEKRKSYDGKASAEKSPVKKSSKRMSSSFFEERDLESRASPKIEDDFSELLKNIPPNNAYFNESVSSFNMDRDSREYEDNSESLFTQTVNEFSKSKNIVPTTKKIGFLGLGNMGKRIVKNLIESGHDVMVWNRSSEKCEEFETVTIAKTASDVVKACDITFSCMANEKVSRTLVEKELADEFAATFFETCSREKKGFVELTCLDPETSEYIHQTITIKGGRYLEAQVTGTWEKAEKGTLFILTAGDNSLFNDCQSCFCSIAETTLFLGTDAGIACKLNIIQNMLLGTSYCAMAESLALIEPIGLGASDFLDILSNGPVNCQDIINKGHAMLDKASSTEIPMNFIQRNILFALRLASSVEQPMQLTAMANEMYKHGKLAGYGEKDVSTIFEALKR